jgi:N-alpha-acetyltransferase 40
VSGLPRFPPDKLTSPGWSPTWIHAQTSAAYALRLVRAGLLTDDELEACFNLVDETSGPDYRASTVGWRPDRKRKEMRAEHLRYVLVLNHRQEVRGFISMMPCFEEGLAVVYCYEIHLKEELRG